MLPTRGELTPKNPISPEFAFTGERSILIEGGSGTVQIQKSIMGSEFFPLTDTLGNVVEYSTDGSVALNASITNTTQSAYYRLFATSIDEPIRFIVCK